MEYKFYVITNTPDLLEQGNTAHEYMYDGYDFTNEEKVLCIGTSKIGKPVGRCKVEVFSVGEIVICDENGREIGYPGRKPSKWYVSYEIFDNLNEAIDKVKSLLYI